MSDRHKANTTSFKPGRSGNPAGRPPGIPSLAAKLRAGIDVEGIIRKMEALALGGDVRAAELLLSRTVPELKPESVQRPVPGLSGHGSRGANARALLDAVAAGTIDAESAARLLTVVPDLPTTPADETEHVGRAMARVLRRLPAPD